jgi:hypothetical protein
MGREGALPNPFYETGTLIPKPVKEKSIKGIIAQFS